MAGALISEAEAYPDEQVSAINLCIHWLVVGNLPMQFARWVVENQYSPTMNSLLPAVMLANYQKVLVTIKR